VLPLLSKLKGTALGFLFPQCCIGYGRGGELLFHTCLITLTCVISPLCPRYGQPQPGGVVCPNCLSQQAHTDGIHSPFRFDGVIRQAIHQLKYKNPRALARPLAGLLKEYLAANTIPGEVLIPVPLHPRRLLERGYDQSNLLARELSKLTSTPGADDCLIRQRHSPP
jgi:predicted amidophosphoribosyltransferase